MVQRICIFTFSLSYQLNLFLKITKQRSISKLKDMKTCRHILANCNRSDLIIAAKWYKQQYRYYEQNFTPSLYKNGIEIVSDNLKKMKVICAGFPKTGTKSLAMALRELGYSVYDTEEHLQVMILLITVFSLVYNLHPLI